MKLLLLLLIPFLFLGSCDDTDEETKYFADYLKKYHSLEIPSESHAYLVFFTEGCAGCIDKIQKKLIGKQSIKPSTTLIITGNSSKCPKELEHLQKLDNVKYENKNEFQNYGMNTGNTVVILTESGKIREVIAIEYKNLNDVDKYL